MALLSHPGTTGPAAATHRDYALLAALAAIYILVRAGFLTEPLSSDEGSYAHIAAELLAGSLPYRDLYEVKPPGIFFLYALFIKLWGQTALAIKLGALAWTTLSLGLLWRLAWLLGGRLAAFVTAGLYAVYSLGPLSGGEAANVEVFAALPLVLLLLLVVGVPQPAGAGSAAGRWFAAGLCCSAALLLKTNLAPFALLALVAAWRLAGDWRLRARALVGLAAGGLLPVLFIAAWYAGQGALADYWYWNITYASRYAGTGASLALGRLGTAFGFLQLEQLGLWLAGLATADRLVALARRPESRGAADRRWLAGGAALAATAALLLPGRFFPHYFQLLVPWFALAAGVALAAGDLWPARQRALVAILVVAGLSYNLASLWPYFGLYGPVEVAQFKPGGYRANPGQSPAIAAWLRSQHRLAGQPVSQPADRLLVWGGQPELYYLSGLPAATPFTSSLAVSLAPDPGLARQRLADSLLRPVAAGGARLVVVQRDDALYAYSRHAGYDLVRAALYERYLYAGSLGYAWLFMRDPGDGLRACHPRADRLRRPAADLLPLAPTGGAPLSP